MTTTVDLWVDPICPYAWMTSRWLLEVEPERDLELKFHIMSLSVLNDGVEGLPDFYRELLEQGWGPVRIAIAVERDHGSEALRRFYDTFGDLHHVGGADLGPELFTQVLDKAGLPRELAAAADDAALDEPLGVSHHAGMDAVGEEVGTPVLHIHTDGGLVAFFGPVVVPPPTGEAAVKLWDGVVAVASTDGFFELKRSRDREPGDYLRPGQG